VEIRVGNCDRDWDWGLEIWDGRLGLGFWGLEIRNWRLGIGDCGLRLGIENLDWVYNNGLFNLKR